MQVTKPSDKEIVLTQTFSAPREVVFAALTQPDHITRWMTPTGMSLVSCELDLRVGGAIRYVFQRPNGRKIEVRGAVEEAHAPHWFRYVETYDFSPLRILVTTTLEERDERTDFKQTLLYATKEARDADFEGVATSSAEVYANLVRYLAK